MNHLFSALVLVFALGAQANTVQSVFLPDSVIPQDLKVKILAQLNGTCGRYVSNYGLTEVQTATRIDRIDQGIVDYYYTTIFSSRHYAMDGVHPTTSYITVESQNIDVNNPPDARYSVTSIAVDGYTCE